MDLWYKQASFCSHCSLQLSFNLAFSLNDNKCGYKTSCLSLRWLFFNYSVNNVLQALNCCNLLFTDINCLYVLIRKIIFIDAARAYSQWKLKKILPKKNIDAHINVFFVVVGLACYKNSLLDVGLLLQESQISYLQGLYCCTVLWFLGKKLNFCLLIFYRLPPQPILISRKLWRNLFAQQKLLPFNFPFFVNTNILLNATLTW